MTILTILYFNVVEILLSDFGIHVWKLISLKVNSNSK